MRNTIKNYLYQHLSRLILTIWNVIETLKGNFGISVSIAGLIGAVYIFVSYVMDIYLDVTYDPDMDI